MPVASPLTQPIFLANFAANSLIGVQAPQLALAVAIGLEIYAGGGLIVQTIDAGTAGAGVGTGVGVTVTPPTLVGTLTTSFAANGLLGSMAPMLINGLALSFSLVLQQAIVTTVHAGVGVGAGVSTLVPNGGVSASAWTAGFAAAGLVGPNIPQLTLAIAQGFDLAAPTAIGAVAIAGPPSPVGSSGTGIGKLL